MDGPARMPFDPSFHFGMLAGGVFIDDGCDRLAGRNLALGGIEEANVPLVPKLLHAAADDTAIEHVEQRRRTVVLVIMRLGAAVARLQRQPRLGAIKRLDQAFLADGQHQGMRRRAEAVASMGALSERLTIT